MTTKVKDFILKYRRLFIVLIHATLITLAYALSFASRFEIIFYRSPETLSLFTSTILPLLVLRLSSYWYFDLFKGLWRYVGIKDFVSIIKASLLGTLLFAFYIFETARGEGFPRSLFVIDFAYNIMFVGGIRMAIRIYRENIDKVRLKELLSAKNVLIIGAGDAGEMILREMQHNPRLGYNAVGFIDDDRDKRGTTIHGIEVLGNTRDIFRIVKSNEVDEIIIALPSATGKAMRRVV